jgi:hypothetical protein
VRGDFTRFTYTPARHYTGVRQQQGRVTVDADANELQDIGEHLRTTTTADVAGTSGAPQSHAGFGLTAGGGTLTIGAGRYYVDGVLCECETAVPVGDQPDLPAGSPYVRLPDGTESASPGPGTYLAYLDVWSRLVTALDDDTIRETALGGPDTATRVKTVWQVRLLRVGDAGAAITCGTPLPGWDALVAPPTGTLAARAQVDETAPRPCVVPAGAGYRRLENQLYRVEIHRGGSTGTATFVWSRDNGSVERRWETTSGPDLTLSAPTGDPSAALPSGGWVELTDDTHELTGRPGTLVRAVRPRDTVLEVDPTTATGSIATADFPINRKVRRWDSDGEITVDVPAANGGWMALEDGVEVRFAAGTYRTGDFWTIPARTATTDVEWPRTGGVPGQRAPQGVPHSHAKLAVVKFDGTTWTIVDDCRDLFPPLTGLTELFYLSGDGQEALPDPGGALVALAQPLRAGVSRGSTPIEGATVEFAVVAGNGQVNGAASVRVTTDASGVASCAWSLDSTTASQLVTARLLDKTSTPVHLPVTFAAELSVAAEVGYDPRACPDLAGATTVQAAIDRLCMLHNGGCATLVVVPGEGWRAAIEALPDGIDAHICFAAGTFLVDSPLRIGNKGRLSISGAGAGTVISAPKNETALLLTDCVAVQVSDLAVVSGLTGAGGPAANIAGTLTVVGCDDVVIERVSATCQAGPRRAAACVTVRPELHDGGNFASVLSRVHVRDCRLTVGHLQVGVLALNADRVMVADNRIAVTADRAGATLADILKDPIRRALLAKQLAARPVLPTVVPPPPSGQVNTTISAGQWLVRFASPVAAPEWQRLAADNPPSADELASNAGMTRYAQRLQSLAIDQPARLPGYSRQLTDLQRVLGNRFGEFTGGDSGRRVLGDLLVTGDVQVVSAVKAPDRTTQAQVGNQSVHFDSVLPASAWQSVIAAAAPGAALDPRKVVRTAAKRLVVDEAFRNRFPDVARWWAGLAAVQMPAMAQAVVIGGRVARHVMVRGNTIAGAVEAVRVGVSHETTGPRQPYDTAGAVMVDGNVITMRIPVEQTNARLAVFVGNADHVVVADNDVSAPGAAPEERKIREGVVVHGHLGPMVQVRANLLRNCAAGIHVVPLPGGGGMALVADNVARFAGVAVVAQAGVIDRDNIT